MWTKASRSSNGRPKRRNDSEVLVSLLPRNPFTLSLPLEQEEEDSERKKRAKELAKIAKKQERTTMASGTDKLKRGLFFSLVPSFVPSKPRMISRGCPGNAAFRPKPKFNVQFCPGEAAHIRPCLTGVHNICPITPACSHPRSCCRCHVRLFIIIKMTIHPVSISVPALALKVCCRRTSPQLPLVIKTKTERRRPFPPPMPL